MVRVLMGEFDIALIIYVWQHTTTTLAQVILSFARTCLEFVVRYYVKTKIPDAYDVHTIVRIQEILRGR